ncbi:hypothetical protein NUW54_g10728 [Trametes sanguinea]|uniref:Uncharacterized protein n=1 Tax=Trametes sanguinea TaxID=158606 RepID=A0ACC1NU21_9APHY|nr:hypothetical protein NUW54_g10728 [Trametes sanguinea]
MEDKNPSLILWFFDSRGGFSEGANSTALPDWVDASVADWIQLTVSKMNAVWGPADRVARGSLVFVHIPPCACGAGPSAWLEQHPRPTRALTVRIHHHIPATWAFLMRSQRVCAPADVLGEGSTQATSDPTNNGKDQPFWDAVNAEIKNLHGVISGHDHGNEWCKRETTKNVIFCFDKHSGYGGYSSAGWGHGVRNVVFRSPNPSIGPETWIRMEDGSTHAQIIMDDSYN